MLAANELSYTFHKSDTPVLRNVSFEVAPGEVTAIIGANGSGKSTLARLAAGALAPTSGSVSIDGEPLGRGWPRVGLMHQDPKAQLVSESVYEEVALGLRSLGLDNEEIRLRVQDALDKCGIAHLANSSTADLSGGEQQLLALAGTIVYEPRYLVLDEPTSQLDTTSRIHFANLVVRLVKRGVGVLLVTHRLEVALECDRLLVMNDGLLAWQGTPEELLKREDVLRVAKMEDSEVLHLHDSSSGEPLRLDLHPGNVRVLSLDRISVVQNNTDILQDVSCAFSSGSITLVSGRAGSGKTTMAMVASGVIRPTQGEVSIDGRAVRRGDVGLCQQHPEEQLFCDTVWDEVAFGPRNLGLTEEEVDERVRWALQALNVREGLWRRHPFLLSGGERRRVAIAGIIAMDFSAYIFDEPTAGLDGDGRKLVRNVARAIANMGRPVVVISHDVGEWLEAVDTVVLLSGGFVSYVGGADEARESVLPFNRAGLVPPISVLSRLSLDTNDQIKAAAMGAMPKRSGVRRGPLHKVSAGAKILGLLALTVVVFATSSIPVIACCLVASILLLALSQVGLQDVAKVLRNGSVVLLFALLANSLLLDGTGDIRLLWNVGLSYAGMLRGLRAVLRITAISNASLAVVHTTSATEAATALLKPFSLLTKLGVRLPLEEMRLTMALTLHAIPLSIDEYRRVEIAQCIRRAPLHEGGLRTRLASWLSVLVPAVAALLRHAEDYANALSQRGVGKA